MTTEHAGDDFEQLVHATARRLHLAALVLTGGDHHQAEDLVQTTYTKVFASWRKVTRADDPVAYTRTILTNTFLSQRRLKRSTEHVTDAVPESAVDDVGSDLRLDLLATLSALEPRDRAVLVLRYWDDRSVAETARVLGISANAVSVRAHRALARLRDHLPDLDLQDRG